MELSIFDFDDYKAYLRAHVASLPRQGRGQYRKISQYLSVSPVFVSQVFKGDRQLTLEQGHLLAEYLGLNATENKYLLAMVSLARAGHHKLKAHFTNELEELKIKAQEVRAKVPALKELNEDKKAHYYSSWVFSASRLATNIDGLNNLESISKRLDIPSRKLRIIMEFLLENGLCIEDKKGYQPGSSWVHIGRESPLVNRHHQNWRLKAFENMERSQADDLFFTSPFTLSKKDIPKVREQLNDSVKKVVNTVKASGSDTLACLNIDWFEF